jgi:hypothetical protein
MHRRSVETECEENLTPATARLYLRGKIRSSGLTDLLMNLKTPPFVAWAVAFVILALLLVLIANRHGGQLELPSRNNEEPSEMQVPVSIASVTATNPMASIVVSTDSTTLALLATTSSVASKTPLNWAAYTNTEVHYSISYPNPQDVTISHPDYRPGDTLISWSSAVGWSTPADSEATIDIQALDPNDQNLTAAQFVDKDSRLLPNDPSLTRQPLSVDTFQGFLVLDPIGGNIEAEMYPENPNVNLVFEIDFQMPEGPESYPMFWQEMLQTFSLSASGSVSCSGSSQCADWH